MIEGKHAGGFMDLKGAIKRAVANHNDMLGQIPYPDELVVEIEAAVVRELSECSDPEDDKHENGKIEFVTDAELLARLR